MRALVQRVLLAVILRRAILGSSTTSAVKVTRELEDWPPFDVGGPTTSAWREEALSKAKELTGLADWLRSRPDGLSPGGRRLLQSARDQIAAARATASGEDHLPRWKLLARLKAWVGGAAVERTMWNLDAAETDLLRIAPEDFVCGQMPGLQAHINRYVRKDDPRRMRVAAIAGAAKSRELSAAERDTVVGAHHAANSQRRRDIMRVRSFRNILVVATVTSALIATGVGVYGFFGHQHVSLCFLPVVEDGGSESQRMVVCPTSQAPLPDPTEADAAIDGASNPWDLLLVEGIGLVAAAVAGSIAVRNIKGTSTPYSLPVAVAVLKLPVGALTAVLGLVLMSGEFVPGLTALDSSAQILAWAVVFGYAQQLFTRLVDQQADTVLDNAGGRGDDRSKAAT